MTRFKKEWGRNKNLWRRTNIR